MKALYKTMLVATAVALTLTLASCEAEDDDDAPSTPSVTLPKSEGTNNLSGKSWTCNRTSYVTEIWTFSDSTMTEVTTSGSSKRTTTYRYTYNSSTGVLYLAYSTIDLNGTTVASVEDYVNYYKIATTSNDKLAYYTYEGRARWATPKVYAYAIDGTSLQITDEYFTGELPTAASFSSTYVSLSSNGYIRLSGNGNNYQLWPSYSNGNFTATMFKDDEETLIGTAKGSYTTSGTGTQDCTVTLTFSSLPIIINAKEDTEYKLSKQSSSTRIYTLVN